MGCTEAALGSSDATLYRPSKGAVDAWGSFDPEKVSSGVKPLPMNLGKVLTRVHYQTTIFFPLQDFSWLRTSSVRSRKGTLRLNPVVAVSMPELSLDEWRVILSSRPNVLIEGPEAAIEAMLRALRPHCREPLSYWGDALGDQRPPTLIVRDAPALTATDQQRLLRWLDQGERSQVLSTSTQSLFFLVERGQFLADLFYRLNVFRFDVTTSGSERA